MIVGSARTFGGSRPRIKNCQAPRPRRESNPTALGAPRQGTDGGGDQ